MSTSIAPSLIPQPIELNPINGTFELSADSTIAFADEAARQPAELLATQLRPATGFKLPVKPNTKGSIVFQTQKDPALGPEGYELRVTSHISIEAPSVAGLFYGSQTLRQLLPPEIYASKKISKGWTIQGVEIRDLPRFRWRGMHLDVARHFMPKKEVLHFIDTLASLKFNTFHWHLTDDQGWRIEIKKYPKLTTIGAWRKETLVGHNDDRPRRYDGLCHGGFYTQSDLREVVAYATERHIRIVPEIDMPGHMQAAIAAYPELGCTEHPLEVMKEWGICKNILNLEESTFQFCKDVLTEVMDLFPSEFIHIGGDEAEKEQWEASERIQDLRKKRGLNNMQAMQSEFIQRIADFLKSNNRRLIGWDEIAEGGLAEKATIMWWRGESLGNVGFEIAKKSVQNGHDLVIAVNSHLYFDAYQSMDPHEPLAIGEFIPLESTYSFEPEIEGLNHTEAAHILGVQGQLWTEYMPDIEKVEYMAFPRACALAELAWLPKKKKNFATFLRRMQMQEKRFAATGVNFRKSKSVMPHTTAP